jgi:hypothetical protein
MVHCWTVKLLSCECFSIQRLLCGISGYARRTTKHAQVKKVDDLVGIG